MLASTTFFCCKGCSALEQQILLLMDCVDMGDENTPINTCCARSQKIAFMNESDLYLVIDKKISNAMSLYFVQCVAAKAGKGLH